MRHFQILVVGGVLVLLVSLIYRDYGVSYDDVVHLNNGDWIMIWYGTLGKVDSAVTATSSKYYAGLADVLTQAVANVGTMAFGWDHFEERHFINALIGLLGVFYTFRVGNLLGGPALGACASLMLLLTPRWFGHMFDNPKDIPFATGYMAALFYILPPTVNNQSYDWKLCAKIGLAIGAALGVRIGGLFLYVTLLFSILLWLLGQAFHPGEGSPIGLKSEVRMARCNPSWVQVIEESIGFFLPRILLIWLISWTVMVLVWPYVQLAPFTRPFQVMGVMSHYPWPGEIWFKGQSIPASQAPMDYLPTWLLLTLPEFYFLGLILGLGVLLHSYLKNRLDLFTLSPYLILTFSVLFPILVIILRHSTVYDGMRHVMFILPPLAILASAGILGFWRRCPSRSARMAFGPALAVTMALALYDIITLHPYQTIYFNRLFAGGVKQALSRYNGDYWGQTYHAGADWIVAHYPTETFNIGVPYMAKRLGYYLNRKEEIQLRRRKLLAWMKGKSTSDEERVPRLRAVGPDWDGISRVDGSLFWGKQYKLYMSGTEFKWNEKIKGETLYSVSRQGALLLEVKAVDGGAP